MKDINLKDYFNKINVEEDFFYKLCTIVNQGKNVLSQSQVIETLIIDDSWIRTIENGLYSIEKIARDPKKHIIDEEILVNVEKAKKTDASTIRHLSSHTNFIRAIDEFGNIQPSKVLTKEMQEDMCIYENRFVYTLVLRLLSFIEQRYVAIKDQIDTFDTTNLKMHSKFKIDKGEVEYDMDIKVRNEPENKVLLEKNLELLRILEKIKKRILIIKNSSFGRVLSKAKLINPPIMKTNIINMQKDYNNCYKLWMFISSYTTVGFSVEISDKILPMDSEYYDDLTMLIAISMKTMIENNVIRNPLYEGIKFNEKKLKKFKEIRKIEYTPTFRGVAEIEDKDAINQFYFEKLKKLVSNSEEMKTEELVNTKSINITFQRFFRTINKMTNELYKELLGISKYQTPLKKQTVLQKKYLEYKRQEELYKKYRILSSLKTNELSQTLKREATQRIRLERYKFDYEQQKAKQEKKKLEKKISLLPVDDDMPEKVKKLFLKAQKSEDERLKKEEDRQNKKIGKEEKKGKGKPKAKAKNNDNE